MQVTVNSRVAGVHRHKSSKRKYNLCKEALSNQVKSEEVILVQESAVVSDVQHEATVKTDKARDATVGELINHSAPEGFRPHARVTSEATDVSNEY